MVVGLAVGADDYLTKPFSPRARRASAALLRRVERRRADRQAGRDAVRRRSGARPRHSPRPPGRRHRAPHAHRVRLARASRFSPGPGVHARQLLVQVWGYHDDAGARTVDSHVRAVRRKLSPDVIRTVHGVGYAPTTPSSPPHRAPGPIMSRRPLDTVSLLKIKLGAVVLSAVAVTVFVFWLCLKAGVAVDQRGHRRFPGAGDGAVPRPRDDVAVAGDVRRGQGHGQGQL